MRFILKNKRIFLALLGLVTLLMGFGLKDVRVDFSFDSFNPPDESEYIIYQAYTKQFGYADNTVQVAFRNPDGQLFERDFLQKVDRVMQSIGEIAHVDSVIRPGNLRVFRRSPGSMEPKSEPVFDLSSDAGVASGKKILLEDTLLGSNLISKNQEYFASLALIDPSILDSTIRDTISHKIERLLAQSELDHQVSGIPLIRTQYVRRITSELFVFLALSILLIVAILFVTYRSIWGILFPLMAVLISLVWCLGFMGLIGTPLDLMSELLPPIIFVVGMSDIIHMVTKYVEELKSGKDKQAAMEATLAEIGMATLLTSITTAIGFGSLLVSQMPPLKSFGFYAASGVIFAYIIAIILVPNFLMRLDKEKLIASKGVGNLKTIDRWMAGMFQWVIKYPVRIVAGFLVVIVVSFYGMTQISFNTFLLDDISEGDPIRQSLTFFETHFYGMRPFEMGIKARPGHKATDLEVLQDMEKIQGFLRSEVEMSPFFSPVTFLKAANKTYHGGLNSFYRLPRTQRKVDEYLDGTLAFGGPDALRNILSEDWKLARMSARMQDVGTDSFNVIRKNLRNFIATECDTSAFEYRLTGSAILNETNVDHLRFSLFSGLLLAFALIGIIMGILFRSWKMLLVGVFVNIIPLLFTAGIMGFAGITLKASTSIIFLIAYGIAVDDTIHFLSRFKLELSEGKSMDEAIRATIHGTGKAIILTSLILLFGFILLLTSDFGGTFSIGLFTALTLLTALLSDLLLLPVLIRWLGVGKKNTSKTE